jgi:hypothetical protein
VEVVGNRDGRGGAQDKAEYLGFHACIVPSGTCRCGSRIKLRDDGGGILRFSEEKGSPKPGDIIVSIIYF